MYECLRQTQTYLVTDNGLSSLIYIVSKDLPPDDGTKKGVSR